MILLSSREVNCARRAFVFSSIRAIADIATFKYTKKKFFMAKWLESAHCECEFLPIKGMSIIEKLTIRGA
jgi:hypothetical protein